MVTRMAVCGLGLVALVLLVMGAGTPSGAHADDPTSDRLATAEARVTALETAVVESQDRIRLTSNRTFDMVKLSEGVPGVPAPGEARINCDIIKSPFYGSDNPYNKDYTLVCSP